MNRAPLAILILAMTLSLNTVAFAQKAKTDLGKKEYELQCAICHGMGCEG